MLSILQAGRGSTLIFSVFVLVVTLYFFYQKRAIPVPKLAAVEAISEGVERAVEMGKPVHYTGGDASTLSDASLAPMNVATLNGLAFTAGLTAEKGARLVVTCGASPELLPLLQKVVYEQYRLKGKADKYDSKNVRFYGSSYSAGILDFFAGEGVACNIMLGASSGDALVVQDSARRHGAINIGGTARWIMQYAFAVLADYMLIGEEIYIASAVMSNDPVQIATIRTGDIIKTISLVILIVAAVLSLAGLNTIQTILKW